MITEIESVDKSTLETV